MDFFCSCAVFFLPLSLQYIDPYLGLWVLGHDAPRELARPGPGRGHRDRLQEEDIGWVLEICPLHDREQMP